jgi:hypothetical protein
MTPSAPAPCPNPLVRLASDLLDALARFRAWADAYVHKPATLDVPEVIEGFRLWAQTAAAAYAAERELEGSGLGPASYADDVPRMGAAPRLRGWLRGMRHGDLGGWGVGASGVWAMRFLDVADLATDTDRLRLIVGELRRLSTAAAASPPSASTRSSIPVIWYHGEHSYSTDGDRPRNVSPEMHNFLTAFLDREVAIETRELEEAGVSNAAAVAGKIAERFGEASVSRPGCKGEGYFLRVQSLRGN